MIYKKITKLDNSPYQEIQFVLDNGEIVYLRFNWCSNVGYWYLDIEYKDFVLNNTQVVYTDSLLRQFNNIIPFDILVLSNTGLSPMEIDSFSNGYNNIIIADKTNE